MTKVTILDTVLSICILVLNIQVAYIYNLLQKLLGIDTETDEFEQNASEDIHQRVIKAKDITEIAQVYGYIIREHVVTTQDKYILVVHKLEKPGQETMSNDKVAYFHHGLLTNSELFLLGSKKEKILPFLLVDLGYDVWLGNNRGNKYSRKHTKLSVRDAAFWDFSLDEFAMYDIPNTIDYILSFYRSTTKITYIGFSQGCSQLFAGLSLNPELNTKINLFVGLSPAIVPQNLNHPIFRVIVNRSANNNKFLYSLFGNKAILPSVAFWSYFLGSNIYEKVVDKSLVYLFGWSGENISKTQKKVGYPHMFSNSSVKSLIHWFQIISSKRFQMFDEVCSVGMTKLSNISTISQIKSSRVAPFPVSHHLNVRMLLFYGGIDILVDIESTKKLIIENNRRMKSKLIDIIKCPGYEHMDTLWANNVYDNVFAKVIDTMEAIHFDPKDSNIYISEKYVGEDIESI